jgi:hypothetical protein
MIMRTGAITDVSNYIMLIIRLIRLITIITVTITTYYYN